MAWTVLPSYPTGNALTEAMLDAIKANINESAVAKATTVGRWFIATGPTAIAERAITSDIVLTQQSTSSTSYVNLTTVGPTVTVTTGPSALIMIQAQMFHSGTGSCWSSYTVSGATSDTAVDQWAITCEADATNSFKMGNTTLHTLTSGSNTVQQKYRGGSASATFDDRHLIVMAL